MTTAVTRELLDVTKGVGDDLEASMRRMRRCSGRRPANFYADYVRPIVLELAAGVVWPIWWTHRDLAPPDQFNGDDGVYDPRWTYVPKAEARRAAQLLHDTYQQLYKAWELVERSTLPKKEKERYSLSLRRALEKCSQAAFNIRQQHPAFAGFKAKEDPLKVRSSRSKRTKASSNKRMQLTRSAKARRRGPRS